MSRISAIRLRVALSGALRRDESVRLLFLRSGHPGQSDCDGRVVELALIRIDRASSIEPENLVGQVETGSNEFQLPIHPVAALNVDLGVSVEVLISQGTLDAHDGIIVPGGISRIMTVLVGVDVGGVVTYRKTPGEAGLVVCEADVPGVGGLSLQRRMIDSSSRKSGREARSRSRIAVVRGNADAAQHSGKDGKALLP